MSEKNKESSKESNVTGCIGCIAIFLVFYSVIYVVVSILHTVYGPAFGSDMTDDDPGLTKFFTLIPIAIFGFLGIGNPIGNLKDIGNRIKNGICYIGCFYAATLFIAGFIDCFYLLYQSLKYGESYPVSILVWLENQDIPVTWIGLRNIFSEFPVFMLFMGIGFMSIFIILRWNTHFK